MSKKTNTFLFILGGTLLNILIIATFFIIFLVIYSNFLHARLPEGGIAWVLTVLFLAAIAASFFIYRLVIKIIMKKINMEKYLDPVFGPRRPPN